MPKREAANLISNLATFSASNNRFSGKKGERGAGEVSANGVANKFFSG